MASRFRLPDAHNDTRIPPEEAPPAWLEPIPAGWPSSSLGDPVDPPEWGDRPVLPRKEVRDA